MLFQSERFGESGRKGLRRFAGPDDEEGICGDREGESGRLEEREEDWGGWDRMKFRRGEDGREGVDGAPL